MRISLMRAPTARSVFGCAALSLVAAAGLLTASSEALLRSSFSHALNTTTAVAAHKAAKSVPVAGTEDYWLSAMRQQPGAPLTKAVAIGDRITLTLAGIDRNFEVASVANYDPGVTEIDTRAAASRFVVITARDSGDADARPIRFIMELEGSVAPAPGTQAQQAQAARAL
ncbi:MAG: hypothetical protein ACRCS9_13535 [Hyphomicrobium sp.]